jgi:hypothetical protein
MPLYQIDGIKVNHISWNIQYEKLPMYIMGKNDSTKRCRVGIAGTIETIEPLPVELFNKKCYGFIYGNTPECGSISLLGLVILEGPRIDDHEPQYLKYIFVCKAVHCDNLQNVPELEEKDRLKPSDYKTTDTIPSPIRYKIWITDFGKNIEAVCKVLKETFGWTTKRLEHPVKSATLLTPDPIIWKQIKTMRNELEAAGATIIIRQTNTNNSEINPYAPSYRTKNKKQLGAQNDST